MKKRFILTYYKYKVRTPIITLFLNKCQNINIKIKYLKKINNEEFTFYSLKKYNKNLQEYKDVIFLGEYGLFNKLFNIFKYKTTLLSLIISLCLFIFSSNYIYNIEISGNKDELIPLIKTELNNYNLKKYQKRIDNKKALEIEKIILRNLKKEIEWIEIRQVGVNLKVKFLKRRVAPILPHVGTSIYAQKDGMVVKFDVSSGVKMVKEYDYVKKGDLLINDTLTNSLGEDKYIGAYGSVYAYTWYIVESNFYLKNNKKKDEVEIYTLLLESNRAKIDKELTGDDEFLVDENILSFENDNNKYSLKIHYTLLEDITL